MKKYDEPIFKFSVVLLILGLLSLFFQDYKTPGFYVSLFVVIINAFLCVIIVLKNKRNKNGE